MSQGERADGRTTPIKGSDRILAEKIGMGSAEILYILMDAQRSQTAAQPGKLSRQLRERRYAARFASHAQLDD